MWETMVRGLNMWKTGLMPTKTVLTHKMCQKRSVLSFSVVLECFRFKYSFYEERRGKKDISGKKLRIDVY